VVEQNPQDGHALYYLSLARAAAGPLDRTWPGWSAGWLAGAGPQLRGALPVLQEFLEARARSRWGDPLSATETGLLQSLALRCGGGDLAAELRRYVEEESQAPDAGDRPGSSPP